MIGLILPTDLPHAEKDTIGNIRRTLIYQTDHISGLNIGNDTKILMLLKLRAIAGLFSTFQSVEDSKTTLHFALKRS